MWSPAATGLWHRRLACDSTGGTPVPRCIRLAVLMSCLVFPGCIKPGPIEVDLSSKPVRFVINHQGWPRPFWWPCVNEFAIATGEDDKGELLWHLESTDSVGEPAHYLAFIYGRVPRGFRQVAPEGERAARPLEHGKVYYVAAGGRGALYRMAFSLPVDPTEVRVP